jgi:dCTP deaminase
MILSDREIQMALDRGMLQITPAVSPERYSSTAIDLTLDGPLQSWQVREGHGMKTFLDPTDKEFNVTRLAQEHTQTIHCDLGVDIQPGSLMLGWTIERLQLPRESRLAARVEGKSSLARIGIGIHITAPTIHAGFGFREGDPSFVGNPIQLEIWNFGPFNVRLTKGMPICQLIFEEVHGTPLKGYEGRFRVQGPDETATSHGRATPARRSARRTGRSGPDRSR